MEIARLRGELALSVIICTYNRANLLAEALKSVALSSLPKGVEWEVLVVDNNSTDQTRRIVEEAVQSHPGLFRYVFERQQGLSHARNAGIREARGEIITFTDDDVTMDAKWLWRLTENLQNSPYVGAGGRVIPVWNCQPPGWFPVDKPWGAIVQFDCGPEPGLLSEPPLGANMAFRKEAFTKYGGFRTDLGRCGDNLLSSEDIEFGRRLLSAGECIRYEPASEVYHPVPQNRLTKEYILGWWFGRGRSDVLERGIPPSTKLLIVGVPFLLFPRLAISLLRWMATINPARRFNAKLTLWNLAGTITEHYAVYRGRQQGQSTRRQETSL